MGAYEVTMRLYKAVMQGDANADAEPSCCSATSTEYVYSDANEDEKDLRPVERVTWFDAIYFCNKLSVKTGKVPYYTITGLTVKQNTAEGASKGYRLPTEAEWEYAARGTNSSAASWNNFFAGKASSSTNSVNKDLDSVGWYRYNCETGTTDSNLPEKEGTHRVGLKAPVSDSLKLYDMSGNVREWCYDWYDTIKADTPFAGPSNSSRGGRINRGGTFKDPAKDCYVESRGWNEPSFTYGDLGLRVCCSVED